MRPPTVTIQDEIAKAEESVAEGRTRWPALSYEEGVSAALRWAIGETEDRPMEDE